MSGALSVYSLKLVYFPWSCFFFFFLNSDNKPINLGSFILAKNPGCVAGKMLALHRTDLDSK